MGNFALCTSQNENVIYLKPRTIVGSNRTADVKIVLPSVQPHHLVIDSIAETVTALGSDCYLNNIPLVIKKPTIFNRGDNIKIKSQEYFIRSEDNLVNDISAEQGNGQPIVSEFYNLLLDEANVLKTDDHIVCSKVALTKSDEPHLLKAAVVDDPLPNISTPISSSMNKKTIDLHEAVVEKDIIEKLKTQSVTEKDINLAKDEIREDIMDVVESKFNEMADDFQAKITDHIKEEIKDDIVIEVREDVLENVTTQLNKALEAEESSSCQIIEVNDIENARSEDEVITKKTTNAKAAKAGAVRRRATLVSNEIVEAKNLKENLKEAVVSAASKDLPKRKSKKRMSLSINRKPKIAKVVVEESKPKYVRRKAAGGSPVPGPNLQKSRRK